jgi:hypothetical protein
MNELIQQAKETAPSVGVFSTLQGFEHWQRVAKMISESNIVPQNYQKNVANVMIAIEMANRIGVSPFMVMQNLDIIKGKPSWSSTFIISAINSCGRFEPLRFVFEGEKKTDAFGCRAITTDKNGLVCQGPLVNWAMVKAEGWLDKAGSKWKTMPELMFQYRAASFFGRLYAPDIMNGMHSVEEVKDYVVTIDHSAELDRLKELFFEKEEVLADEAKTNIQRVIDNKEEANYAKAIKYMEGL